MPQHDEPGARDSASCFRWKFLAPTMVLWVLLFALGFPPAHFDDLFFIGAPMNLALHGEYKNPFLLIVAPFSDQGFYFHPPFYSYVLAGWLKCFGIHTASFRAFVCLCGLVSSLNLAAVFHRSRISVWAYLAVLFALAGLAASQGLRHDHLGLALLFSGINLLTADRPPRWFWGLACVGAAALSTPVLLAYCIAGTGACAVFHFFRARPVEAKWWGKRLGALAAAVGLITMLFLLCLHFDWRTFVQDFTRHADMRRPPAGAAFLHYFTWVLRPWRWVTDLPVLLLFLAGAAYWLAQWRRLNLAERVAGLGLMVGLLLNFMLNSLTFYHITFFCWLALAVWLGSGRLPSRPALRRGVLMVAGAIFLLNHSFLLLRAVFQERAHPERYAAIRQYVASHPDRNYAIDAFAARHVFDYQLPAHTRAWEFFLPLPESAPGTVQQKGDWVWIASTYHLGLYTPDTGVTYDRIRFLGREFKSLASKPSEIILLE